MNTDNGIRGSSGVVASLVEIEPGRLRLVLDDVKNGSGSRCGPWTHHVLYTFKDYGASDILDLKLSDKELADFGHHVLARLGVLHTRHIR